MKKICNNDITHYDKDDLTCCMKKVSLTSNDNVKNIPKKMNKQKKNIKTLILIFYL